MSEPDDRDERVSMYGADPVEALRALLQVDPESEPVDDEPQDGDTATRFGPRQQEGPTTDEDRAGDPEALRM